MRALIVEDDLPLREGLVAALADAGMEVIEAEGVEAGISALDRLPHLLVLDIGLPDGRGLAVAEEAVRRRPTPAIIAISADITPREAFQLGKLGVRGFVEKPLRLTSVMATIETVLAEAPRIEPHLVGLVGTRPFHEILAGVRAVLAEQALAMSGGNRTKAAELLSVTRQAVQQMIRDLELHSATTQ